MAELQLLKGIDISSFQGKPDYAPLVSQIDFLIAKASEGVGFKDSSFDYNLSAARGHAIPHGFYHFARPDLGNSAQVEADWFLQTVGSLQKDELLALDYEVNFADPVKWCKDWLDEVAAKTGCKPLIYLNLSLVHGYDWTAVINAGYGLWLADYDGVAADAPDTPWPLVALKQWSSSGALPVIAGNLDLDTFFGDVAAFKKYGYQPPVSSTTPAFVGPVVTQDEENSLQVLEDALTVLKTTDGQPFGNLEGMTRQLVAAYPLYLLGLKKTTPPWNEPTPSSPAMPPQTAVTPPTEQVVIPNLFQLFYPLLALLKRLLRR